MTRAGLPVPPGFCIAGEVYRAHLEGSGLRGRIAAALAEIDRVGAGERTRILSNLRGAIVAAPLPRQARVEIEEGYRRLVADGARVAVRSSATAEDLPDHSFAGLHDTFLGVGSLPECLDAIRRCWASLWTDRAFEYRARGGIDPLGVEMGVIVQRLVPAEASGVIFTEDPVNDRSDRIIIEGSFGLGEALVSGRVAPDRIVLSRPDLRVRERSIARKTVEVIPDPAGGVHERRPDADRSGRPSLDDASARRLAALALKAEEIFGLPLDVEWAISEGEPHILQARPITARSRRAPRPPRQVWSNVNTGEVLPDVATPMTWSVIEPIVLLLLRGVFARVGILVEDHPLIGLFGGRAYFNLNTVLGCMARIPGVKGKSIAELFGGRQDRAAALGEIELAEEDIPVLRGSKLSVAIGIAGAVFDILTFSAARAQKALLRTRRKADALEVADLGAPDAALAVRIESIYRDLVDFTSLFYAVGISQVHSTMLYDLCNRWIAESGNAIASRLQSGLGRNDNANAGLDLSRLAALAGEHPRVEAAIVEEGSFAAVRRRIAGTGGGDDFLGAWDAFMRTHGHHCRGELELSNPRWSETPDRILDQVRGCLAAPRGRDFISRYRRAAREREETAAACRRRLRNPLKRLAFEFVLRKAQRCAPLRENLKSQAVRSFAAMRRTLIELGSRLARRGLIEGGDDIFFLEIAELKGAARGEMAATIRAKIASRRAEYERNLSITPPPVIAGDFDPQAPEAEPVVGDLRTMRGVAVNPGVVTGPARVILHAGDDDVRPGEILVVPFTDPGWTPYFLNAAAIVMDMGGILSHGSIIAREYGIPAVANVGPATEIIETGQTIEVDGARGIVRIIE